MYLSVNHLCFYSYLMGSETMLVVRWNSVIVSVRDGGREEGTDGRTKGGTKGGREGGMKEEGREGWGERGRETEGGREGGVEEGGRGGGGGEEGGRGGRCGGGNGKSGNVHPMEIQHPVTFLNRVCECGLLLLWRDERFGYTPHNYTTRHHLLCGLSALQRM